MKKLIWDKADDWTNKPLQLIEPELICFRITGSNHSAVGWGKYNLTSSMYDHRYAIPDYCNGQAALLNRKAVVLIAEQIMKTVLDGFRIEDIYFTGILRKKAGITRIRNRNRTSESELLTIIITLFFYILNRQYLSNAVEVHRTKESNRVEHPKLIKTATFFHDAPEFR